MSSLAVPGGGGAMAELPKLHKPAELYVSRRTREVSLPISIALVGLVLLTPLPFGSVTPWAWGTFAALTALILAAWAILAVLGHHSIGGTSGLVRAAAVLYAVVIAWIVIQALPFTPRSWHHPIWLEAARALGGSLTGKISLDPGETMSGLVRLLWYGAIFWLALQMGRNKTHARTGLKLFAWFALAYAAYGLLVNFAGWDVVLWVRKFVYQGDVTGTFINKNSFAAFAGMGLICVTALLIDCVVDIPPSEVDRVGRPTAIVTTLVGRNWSLMLAWVVIFSAIILSNSRAGLVCSILGVIALIVALSFSNAVPLRLGRWFAATIAVVIVGVFVLSGDSIDKSFRYVGEQSQARIAIYETTVEMITDAPVLGMGFGTYPQVFQIYRKSGSDHRIPARKGHNTYLENAAELGIPAAAILVLAVVFLFLMCMTGVRTRRRDVALPATGVATTVLLGLHSVVDFSLQIPAIAASFAFILGLACAQSRSGTRIRGPRSKASAAD